MHDVFCVYRRLTQYVIT